MRVERLDETGRQHVQGRGDRPAAADLVEAQEHATPDGLLPVRRERDRLAGGLEVAEVGQPHPR